MELEDCSLSPQTQGYLRKRPSLVHPISHDLHIQKRHRDRGAFEILRLSGRILGDHSNRDIEPRKTSQTAENEKGKQDMIERRAETKGKRCSSGANTEGYEISQRVEFLTHQAGFAPPARDLAVHEVEEETEGNEAEGPVEVRVVVGVVLDAVAEGGEDGHDAAETFLVLDQWKD